MQGTKTAYQVLADILEHCDNTERLARCGNPSAEALVGVLAAFRLTRQAIFDRIANATRYSSTTMRSDVAIVRGLRDARDMIYDRKMTLHGSQDKAERFEQLHLHLTHEQLRQMLQEIAE